MRRARLLGAGFPSFEAIAAGKSAGAGEGLEFGGSESWGLSPAERQSRRVSREPNLLVTGKPWFRGIPL